MDEIPFLIAVQGRLGYHDTLTGIGTITGEDIDMFGGKALRTMVGITIADYHEPTDDAAE